MINKKILIISFSQIDRDPRVLRQIKILKESYQLFVIGFGDKPEGDNVNYYTFKKNNPILERVKKLICLMFRKYEQAYWENINIKKAVNKIKEKNNYDLIVSNDIDTLPLALAVANNKPVLFDAHEFFPSQFSDRILYRLFIIPYNKYLCRTYIPKVSAMMTVCQGLKDEYERLYQIKSEIITNAPFYEALKPVPVQSNRIRIIHHGGAIPSRNIESMIEMVNHLDGRFYLDFILIPTFPKYYKKLKLITEKNTRINLIEPVSTNQIAKKINEYDIGLYILEPRNFNSKHTLPNKFFEFIQGRVGVAIGPSVEMAKLVNKYKLGVVADSFNPEIIANKLNALSEEDIFEFKVAANKAAMELSADKNAKLIKKMINDLLKLKT